MNDTEPPGPSEPQRSGPWWKRGYVIAAALAGSVAVIVVGIFIVGALQGGDGDDGKTPVEPVTRTVTYRIGGTAQGVDITMENAMGNTEQAQGKAVPLHNSTTGTEGVSFEARPGQYLYISAQNTGATGTVTCVIDVDGVVIETATSSGAYVIASCSGTA